MHLNASALRLGLACCARHEFYYSIGARLLADYSDGDTEEGAHQNGTSKSVLASAASLKGLSVSSAGSAAFEDSAGFALFLFLHAEGF